jgi:coenzyme PQQ synthesis protein D (PqqD)
MTEHAAAVPMLPHDHVIFTDLDGVEGVLVDLNTRQYFQLNETASLIWRGLAKGTPLVEIAAEITQLYDVVMEHAQRSVETAVATFDAHHLLDSKPR